MNEREKNIEPVSAEDIRQYLEGKCSPAEMHRIETAALDDPFIADAIEGIQNAMESGIENFEKDIQELRTKIAADIHSRKKNTVVWRTLWSAAAILVILATAVAITINMRQTADGKGERSKMKGTSSAVAERRLETADVKRQTGDEKQEMAEVKREPANGKQETANVKRQTADVKRETGNEKQEMAEVKDKEEERSVAVNDHFKKEDLSSSKAPAEQLRGKTAGIVIEPSAVPQGIEKDSVAALNESEVVGYSSRNRKNAGGVSVVKQSRDNNAVIPEGGWKAFDDYIARTKSIQTIDSLVHGSVELSFTISKKGKPTDLKIEKSLSEVHDREAIRLIKEGPLWHVTRGRNRKMILSLAF